MKRYKITRYNIKSKKLNQLNEPLKIVFLSDLHGKEYDENNQSLFCAIKKEQPDYIFVGGDMIIGKRNHNMKPTLEFIGKLMTIAPVIYANGNHEQRMKELPHRFSNKFEILKSALDKYRIRRIENQFFDIDDDKKIIRVTGIEIPSKYYDKMMKEKMTDSEMLTCVGKCNQEKYNILLAHNPAHMDAYVKWGADLVLSGHFHGGIIRLPFLGGLISPQGKLFPKHTGGRYKEGGTDIVVSAGLGEHTVKIRFCNQPELIILRLSGEK